MEQSLAGKVVMVTGSTSGIGHAVAVRFAAAGARVVALGRAQSARSEVKSEIERAGAEALTIATDVTNESDLRQALDEAIDKFAGLDVLVNAAGHISSGTIEDTSMTAWDAMMNVTCAPFFISCKWPLRI